MAGEQSSAVHANPISWFAFEPGLPWAIKTDMGRTQLRNGQPTPPLEPDQQYYTSLGQEQLLQTPASLNTFSGSPRGSPEGNRSWRVDKKGGKKGPKTEGGDQEDKDRRKERNREAARKCRSKKKAEIRMLTRAFEEVQAKRSEIDETISSCRYSIYQLRSEILNHHACGNETIDNFIKKMAKDSMKTYGQLIPEQMTTSCRQSVKYGAMPLVTPQNTMVGYDTLLPVTPQLAMATRDESMNLGAMQPITPQNTMAGYEVMQPVIPQNTMAMIHVGKRQEELFGNLPVDLDESYCPFPGFPEGFDESEND